MKNILIWKNEWNWPHNLWQKGTRSTFEALFERATTRVSWGKLGKNQLKSLNKWEQENNQNEKIDFETDPKSPWTELESWRRAWKKVQTHTHRGTWTVQANREARTNENPKNKKLETEKKKIKIKKNLFWQDIIGEHHQERERGPRTCRVFFIKQTGTRNTLKQRFWFWEKAIDGETVNVAGLAHEKVVFWPADREKAR